MKLDRLPSRLISVDIIRILAMLMVLELHTVFNFTIRPDFFATKLWFLLEPSVALSKTCVLLFFMLSGYLVITKNRGIKENWQKTRNRIIIPLFFFSLVNMAFEIYRFHFTGNNTVEFLQGQLMRMTSFPSSPLWFLIVLLFFYLLNPVWQLIFSVKENSKIAQYVVALAFSFALIGTIIKFPSLKNGTFFNNFTGWIGYVFFYLYGGLFRNKWVATFSNKWNIALVMLGLLTTMVGDYYTMFATVHKIPFVYSGYFFDYLSIPVTMMAIGIFNLLINANYDWLNTRAQSFIIWLAGLSFGIYLIHTFVVSFFAEIGFDFNKVGMNVYLYNILNYSLVFGISLILTVIIKKTPKLRSILGE